MKYKAPGTIGELVEWNDTVKNAVRDSDKQEREFAKITTSDGTLWIQTVFVAGEAIPGVIIGEETVLYSKPDAAAPTGTTIPKFTIVGVHPAKESGNFAAVSAYIEGAKSPVVTERFIKKENLITSSQDVRAMQLLQIAKAEKGEVVKKELLKSALETNSSFTDLIQAELDALDPAKQEPIATESASGTYTATADKVNVRDNPNAVSSSVLAQLAKDQAVTITEKTVEPSDVNGVSGYWYKIAEPAGWVFSSFLTEKTE